MFSEKMASKKKGLSLEEKRKKMMEIFFESKDVYLLKGSRKLLINLITAWLEKILRYIFILPVKGRLFFKFIPWGVRKISKSYTKNLACVLRKCVGVYSNTWRGDITHVWSWGTKVKVKAVSSRYTMPLYSVFFLKCTFPLSFVNVKSLSWIHLVTYFIIQWNHFLI